jgi:serine/threonine protein kinase
VIRKEIEFRERDAMGGFQKELENLALLGNLKHDNIIQLYCAYIYRKRYNLIFSLADGGSLKDLLNGKNTKGPKDSQLLLALAELASAIDALHNFTSEALDLKLSGCHHDLAPRNILIHKDTFLLADFGLSSLRNADEDSLTLFKDVSGSYLAPKCQVLQDGHFITSKISRASNIWSFGCILSEVLTYMKCGPDGVDQFRKQRITNVTSDVTWFKFHRGPKRPNPAIEPWLDKLQASGELYYVRMISLIRKMLSMDSKERPHSAKVLMALRGIWIVTFGHSIQLALDSICKARSTVDYILNQMRFRGCVTAGAIAPLP